ncbi:MAG: hypothetical protein ACRCZ0_01680 [Cetobacterium sp.]
MGFRDRYIVITEVNKKEVLSTLETLKCWKFSTGEGIIKPTKIGEFYFTEDVVCIIVDNKRLLFFSTDVLGRYKGEFLRYPEIDLVELKSYL